MGVGRIGGLRENGDAHILLHQCHRVHIVGHLAQDIRFRSDSVKPLADGLHTGFPPGDDQRLIRQLCQRNLHSRQIGQGVFPGNNRHPRLPAHHKSVQMLHVIGCGNHRQVHQSPVELVQHVVAAAVPQLIANQRVFASKPGNPPGRQIGCPPFHNAEADGAGQLFPQIQQVPPGFFPKLQHLHGPLVQQISRLCQCQPPLSPDEQLHPQLFFQKFNLVAQGRLAHLQLFRRPGEVQFLGHHYKVL